MTVYRIMQPTVAILFLSFHYVHTGPVADFEAAACSFPSIQCQDNRKVSRCLTASEVCDGVAQCGTAEDETSCDEAMSQFVNTNHLQSAAVEDTTIAEVTMKACATFCRHTTKFNCVGFQHNLQSNLCKLLDANFTVKTTKPSLRGFWLTFELRENTSSLPSTSNEPSPAFDEAIRPADAREGEHDSIVVEVDLDAFPLSERRKRQSGFSFSEVLGSLVNFFFGSPSSNQPQGRSAKISSAPRCGQRSIEFDPPRRRGGRIINGVTPPYGAFPWQAALKKSAGKSKKFVHHCGGAIVSDTHILTAAHCLIGLRERDLQVTVGEYEVDSKDSEENVYEVEQFYIHHNYYQGHKRSDDIAVVKIRPRSGKGFQFSPKVQPICLPTSESVYKAGQWCTASGWGIQKAGDRSSTANVLQAISVPLLSDDECRRNEVYGSNSPTEALTKGMICAGYLEGGVDACRGDSGGPLACNIDGQFQLLGLVSWGDGCARQNKPGVYVKVSHYIDWIHEQIQKSNQF